MDQCVPVAKSLFQNVDMTVYDWSNKLKLVLSSYIYVDYLNHQLEVLFFISFLFLFKMDFSRHPVYDFVRIQRDYQKTSNLYCCFE